MTEEKAPSNRPSSKYRVWMPLPDTDFDTTEAAVGWAALNDAGIEVVFATEKGANGPISQCDPLLLKGVLFGKLGAEPHAKELYARMIKDPAFNKPIAWADVQPQEYDGLWLSGGHAKGMRQYLGSDVLHAKVAEFWALGRPVAALCHGPIVLARSIDPKTGKSVLYDKKTMCLPKHMEGAAYFLTWMFRGGYYRTYPEYVEDEIKRILKSPNQYVRGDGNAWLGPPKKGTPTDDTNARICVDGNYTSARWPGDAYLLAKTFVQMLQNPAKPTP